jgi:hypothetical protein
MPIVNKHTITLQIHIPLAARTTDFIDGTTEDDILEGSSDYPFAGRSRYPLGEDGESTSPEDVDRVVDANREPIDRPLDAPGIE